MACCVYFQSILDSEIIEWGGGGVDRAGWDAGMLGRED